MVEEHGRGERLCVARDVEAAEDDVADVLRRREQQEGRRHHEQHRSQLSLLLAVHVAAVTTAGRGAIRHVLKVLVARLRVRCGDENGRLLRVV